MQDNITIARPYARAAFEQAQEEGSWEKWFSMLKLLSLIVRDPQMRLISSSPKISHQQLLDLIKGIMDGQLSASNTNFIKILINAGRLHYTPDILQLFEKSWAEAEERMDINIISAYSLEADQVRRISDFMEKKLGKKINISTVEDRFLIGGVIIKVGDSVIDASLRGSLSKLHNNLIG